MSQSLIVASPPPVAIIRPSAEKTGRQSHPCPVGIEGPNFPVKGFPKTKRPSARRWITIPAPLGKKLTPGSGYGGREYQRCTPLSSSQRRRIPVLDCTILHRVVVHAPLAADGEDRHDVGVVQLRRRLGLDLEPPQLLRVQGRGERQDFQRHPAAERDLLG